MSYLETTIGVFAPFAVGRGYSEVVKGVNPAAGAAYVAKVPGGECWRVRAVAFVFTTSAVVANRTVDLSWRDGDNSQFLVIPATTGPQAAGAALTYTGAVGMPFQGHADGNLFPLPDLIMQPGYRFQISATNIDVGDAFSALRLFIERFILGKGGYQTGMQLETEFARGGMG